MARRFNIPLDKLKTQGSLPQEVVGELVHRFISDPDIKQIAEDNPEFKRTLTILQGIKYMKYSLNMQMCTLKTLYQEQGNWMAKIIGLLIRFLTSQSIWTILQKKFLRTGQYY